MIDKEFDKQKKRVKKLKEKWFPIIGLGDYWINIDYERESPFPDHTTNYAPKDVRGVWSTVMETQSDPNYLKARITVYTLQTKEIGDDELEETFLHELCHIHLAIVHTKQYADQEEIVVTKLARALISAWRHK